MSTNSRLHFISRTIATSVGSEIPPRSHHHISISAVQKFIRNVFLICHDSVETISWTLGILGSESWEISIPQHLLSDYW